MLLVNELKEADTFRCYTTADKQTSDNLRDRCYDTLDISYNSVGDEGLKSVSEALQSEECKLQTLNIPANGITHVQWRKAPP